MNIQEVRKVVSQIQTSLFKNSNSYSIGMLKSHFKGTGLKFKEHQIYAHGDDVRFIDWKILAKTSVPYIKTFEEERNIEIVVLIDASPSMFSGFKGVSKLQASIEICSLLYLLARETNDFVHGIIVADEIVDLPKMSGEEGIIRLISKLEEMDILLSDGRVNMDYALREKHRREEKDKKLMKHLHQKKEVVLLSDFDEFLNEDELTRLLARSNVHCFQILSPLDEIEKFPYSILSTNPYQNTGKGEVVQLDLAGKKNNLKSLNKRIKKLRVQERYLEEFVKEML